MRTNLLKEIFKTSEGIVWWFVFFFLKGSVYVWCVQLQGRFQCTRIIPDKKPAEPRVKHTRNLMRLITEALANLVYAESKY